MLDSPSPTARGPPEDAAGPNLFVSYSGWWGGSERVLVDVVSGLEEPLVLL